MEAVWRPGKSSGPSCAQILSAVSARTAPVKRAGELKPARYGEIKRALGYALGWDELIDLG